MPTSILACMLILFLWSPTAHALLITLEPDDFAVGTDVSNAFEGVTLSRFTHIVGTPTPVMTPVHVVSSLSSRWGVTLTGTQMFGDFTQGGYAQGCWAAGLCPRGEDFSALLIQFTAPTNYVDVATVWSVDPGNIYAFGASNELVGSCVGFSIICTGDGRVTAFTHPTPSRSFNTLEIGSLDRGPFISSVIIGGMAGTAGVDRIRYNSVPEPSTFLSLTIGLGAIIALKREMRYKARCRPTL